MIRRLFRQQTGAPQAPIDKVPRAYRCSTSNQINLETPTCRVERKTHPAQVLSISFASILPLVRLLLVLIVLGSVIQLPLVLSLVFGKSADLFVHIFLKLHYWTLTLEVSQTSTLITGVSSLIPTAVPLKILDARLSMLSLSDSTISGGVDEERQDDMVWGMGDVEADSIIV
ncbi:hypothetical protein Tco_0139912 [Tanacetum coccineum]